MRGFSLFPVLVVAAGAGALTMAGEAEFLAQGENSNSGGESLSRGQDGHSDSLLGGCEGESIWARPHLGGDWLGARPGLGKHGIIADIRLTQFYQGVTSGGVEQDFQYGGKLDYQFTFVGGKLGLNEGFTTIMHAETRFGRDVNAATGALAFPNTNMLYPLPGEDVTAITGLLLMQAFSERFALAAGKINVVDFWAMLYPNTGRGIEGFMNLSLIATPIFFRTTNLSFLGAGALVMQGKQIQAGVLVYDTHNSTTTSGFDNLFDDGAVVLGLWRFFTEHRGLPGSHAFIGNWSSRAYTSVDPTSWTILPGVGLVAGQESGSWALAYILEQKLWVDRCNEKRNLGFMSQLALADGNPSFYRYSANAALQAQGLVCGRQDDTMGLGYFYDRLSGDFKRLVSALPRFDLQDVHGAEIYYNAAIAPWFHLTADLQIVDNQNVADNTATIVGLRGQLDF